MDRDISWDIEVDAGARCRRQAPFRQVPFRQVRDPLAWIHIKIPRPRQSTPKEKEIFKEKKKIFSSPS
jgi:hypothetical protein